MRVPHDRSCSATTGEPRRSRGSSTRDRARPAVDVGGRPITGVEMRRWGRIILGGAVVGVLLGGLEAAAAVPGEGPAPAVPDASAAAAVEPVPAAEPVPSAAPVIPPVTVPPAPVPPEAAPLLDVPAPVWTETGGKACSTGIGVLVLATILAPTVPGIVTNALPAEPPDTGIHPSTEVLQAMNTLM